MDSKKTGRNFRQIALMFSIGTHHYDETYVPSEKTD